MAALGDVASFAAAAGVPGFADAGGAVANLLISARNALDAVAGLLALKNYAGAAAQLGLALGAISNATTAVNGAPFLNLLLSKIGWAGARPAGFAKQLGLPASVPGLSMTGNALVYTINAPGRTLIPAPLTFGFDRAELKARLRIGAGDPATLGGARLHGHRSGRRWRRDREPARRRRGSAQADVVVRRRHVATD